MKTSKRAANSSAAAAAVAEAVEEEKVVDTHATATVRLNPSAAGTTAPDAAVASARAAVAVIMARTAVALAMGLDRETRTHVHRTLQMMTITAAHRRHRWCHPRTAMARPHRASPRLVC